MRIEAYNSTNQNFKGYIDSSVYKIAQKQENKLAKLIEQGRITKVSGIEKKLEIKNAINKLKIYAKQLHPQTKITAKELSQTSSGAVENFIEIQAQNKKLNITHPLGKTETFQTHCRQTVLTSISTSFTMMLQSFISFHRIWCLCLWQQSTQRRFRKRLQTCRTLLLLQHRLKLACTKLL